MLSSVTLRFGQVAYGAFLFTCFRNYKYNYTNYQVDLFKPISLIKEGAGLDIGFLMLSFCVSVGEALTVIEVIFDIYRTIKASKSLKQVFLDFNWGTCLDLAWNLTWALRNLTPLSNANFAKKTCNYIDAYSNSAILYFPLGLISEYIAPNFVKNHQATFKLCCYAAGIVAGVSENFIVKLSRSV